MIIVYWMDGDWCYGEELAMMSFKSDDYIKEEVSEDWDDDDIERHVQKETKCNNSMGWEGVFTQ